MTENTRPLGVRDGLRQSLKAMLMQKIILHDLVPAIDIFLDQVSPRDAVHYAVQLETEINGIEHMMKASGLPREKVEAICKLKKPIRTVVLEGEYCWMTEEDER